jgi:hypothetical protein
VKVTSFLAHRDDKRFGEEIRTNLPRLFAEHEAELVQNDASDYGGPRSFDYAVATVVTPDLDLRFVRVRSQFEVEISIPGHRRWDALDSALLWLDMQRGVQTKSNIPNLDWLDWWSIDRFLAENWERMKAAAGARPYLP